MGFSTALSGFGVILYIAGILIGGTALFVAAKILKTNLTFPQAVLVNTITAIFTLLPYGKLLSLFAFFLSVKSISKAGFGEIFILLVLQVMVFFTLVRFANVFS